jgi:hypothetical protein
MAREEKPSDADRAAVVMGLGALMGPTGGGSAGVGSTTTGLASGKLVAIVGGAALVVGLTFMVGDREPNEPAIVETPSVMAEEADSERVAPAAPIDTALAGTEETVAPAEPEKSAASGKPVIVRPKKSTSEPEPEAAQSRPASKPSESSLLDAARRSLAMDPERTLALANQHRVLYPQGMLGQEREMLVVEALRRLGRSDEAKRQDDEFKSRYPSSMHGRDVPVPEGSSRKK